MNGTATMLRDRPDSRISTSTLNWILLGIIVVAFAIRCVGIDTRWLWGDELFSANVSKDGIWTTLLTALRFDTHPPLYYLQLSLWMLVGQSDEWLMLNSVAWSTAAVGILAYTASRVHGPRVGLGAGALLAIAPAAFDYSDDVRMYAMLMALIVLVWYTQTRWIERQSGGTGMVAMILSQCAVAYSHGAGVVMLAGCVLLGGATVLLKRNVMLLRQWIGIEVIVGILVLPAIIFMMMRSVTHPEVPDIATVVSTWTSLTTGNATLDVAFAVVGLVLFAVLVLAGLRNHEAGLQTLMLVFLPLILVGLISHLYRPIWLDRTFATVIPFLCLSLARATLDDGRRLVSAGRRLGMAGFAALLVFWLTLGINEQISRQKGDSFKLAAATVHQMAHPADLVVVSPTYFYWYFLWYYMGPRWGVPLHAFDLNADWRRMLARLPTFLVGVFGQGDADKTVESNGVTVTLWDPDRPLPKVAGDVIVLRQLKLPEFAIPGYRRVAATEGGQLAIERWTRAD